MSQTRLEVLMHYASPGKKSVRSIFSKVKAVFHLRVPQVPFRVIDLPVNSKHTLGFVVKKMTALNAYPI